MKTKKILVWVLSIAVILFFISKVVVSNIEKKAMKNAINNAQQFTLELCERYGMNNPNFSINANEKTKYGDRDSSLNSDYFFVYINFMDKRYELLSLDDKLQFLRDFGNIPSQNRIIYMQKISIPQENSSDYNTYTIDYENKNILLLNYKKIYEYITDEEKDKRKELAKYPPQLKMREKDILYTSLGEPDRIEKSHDFDAMVLRKRHKTYYWEDENFQATVWYTYNIDGTVHGNRECPENNGYVWSITYKDGKWSRTEDLMGVNFYLD